MQRHVGGGAREDVAGESRRHAGDPRVHGAGELGGDGAIGDEAFDFAPGDLPDLGAALAGAQKARIAGESQVEPEQHVARAHGDEVVARAEGPTVLDGDGEDLDLAGGDIVGDRRVVEQDGPAAGDRQRLAGLFQMPGRDTCEQVVEARHHSRRAALLLFDGQRATFEGSVAHAERLARPDHLLGDAAVADPDAVGAAGIREAEGVVVNGLDARVAPRHAVVVLEHHTAVFAAADEGKQGVDAELAPHDLAAARGNDAEQERTRLDERGPLVELGRAGRGRRCDGGGGCDGRRRGRRRDNRRRRPRCGNRRHWGRRGDRRSGRWRRVRNGGRRRVDEFEDGIADAESNQMRQRQLGDLPLADEDAIGAPRIDQEEALLGGVDPGVPAGDAAVAEDNRALVGAADDDRLALERILLSRPSGELRGDDSDPYVLCHDATCAPTACPPGWGASRLTPGR